jgi:hypothetical protein
MFATVASSRRSLRRHGPLQHALLLPPDARQLPLSPCVCFNQNGQESTTPSSTEIEPRSSSFLFAVLRSVHGAVFPANRFTSTRDLGTVAKLGHRSTTFVLESLLFEVCIRRHLQSNLAPETDLLQFQFLCDVVTFFNDHRRRHRAPSGLLPPPNKPWHLLLTQIFQIPS